MGSRWLRWDPHLHAPGTLFNNQFGNDWDAYVRGVDGADPRAQVLGITDYFTLRTYKEVLRRRRDGELAQISLIFPNVEVRLTVETRKASAINLHLLISPDDVDHVKKMEERLARLLFRFENENYPCSDDGLIRLGRAYRREPPLPEAAALSEGANQFKIELVKLRELFESDPWIRANVLIAVAAGEDGLAGLAKDAAFTATREELGRFADIVFSGNPSDRSYWLGEHPDFENNRQRPKPCLHGCDAHNMETLLKPVDDRRCWIRAEPTFDGLRQTLVEPERRVHIGPEVPVRPNPGDVIRTVKIKGATWLRNDIFHLNDGLVTIVGAKGSGKTALAELIAFAAASADAEPGDASFMKKAGELLHGVEIELDWDDGSSNSATIPSSEEPAVPRVRYLSQQFVERLCSEVGLADPLVAEIEQVVFNALPYEDQLRCDSFAELRDVRLADATAEREAARQAIQMMTRQVAEEHATEKSVPTLKANLQNAERDRKAIEEAIKKIPIKASDDKVRAQQQVAVDLQTLTTAIATEERRTQSLRDLEAEAKRQMRYAETTVDDFKAKYGSLLTENDWKLFQPQKPEEALRRLAELVIESSNKVAALRQRGFPQAAEGGAVHGTERRPSRGLAELEAEHQKLTNALGLDRANARKKTDLEIRLAAAKQKEQKVQDSLTHAEGAGERRLRVQANRLDEYRHLFSALAKEEETLRELYKSLRERIEADARLKKLSFTVKRNVDIESWAIRGEELLDLRKLPFQGHGTLMELTKAELLEAWTAGTADKARDALKAFVTKHSSEAISALKEGVTLVDLGEWLFSTDHINVRYALEYEGVEVPSLSPGTRGVVLLTLYLGLDQWDQRPLLIDQPEENLDPRSVYTELVPFFRDATRRRQVIMVTHNANLVVNADSDQVIVATAHRRTPKELPVIEYIAGGLENPTIRAQVCELLEGGEEAFIKRGQRYGIRIERSIS